MVTTTMSNEVIISICIANFNGEHFIEECLNSILQQTFKMPIEIIVHDDASTDRSVMILKSKYPDIQLIESKTNVGFCVANNKMAAKARGRYLLLLNNDATLFEDSLQVLYSEAQAGEALTIYGLPQYYADTKEFLDCGAFIDPFFNAVPNKMVARQEVAMVAGACFWIPQSLWDELGGFPEWFESIAEDLYLCSRARLAGYSVIALPISGFYHHVGESFGGGKLKNNKLNTTLKRRALSERNRLLTQLIITPWSWLVFVLPVQLMMLCIEGICISVIKRQASIWNQVYAPALSAIYKQSEHWILWRKHTQQSKRISFKDWLRVMKWIPYKLTMFIRHGIPDIQ